VLPCYFLIFKLICLNLNLNLVRNQAQTRKELKNYLVIPMLTVSCSRPIELDQAISSIIQNPKSYQTVVRLTCIGGKRHILQALLLWFEKNTTLFEKITPSFLKKTASSGSLARNNHEQQAKGVWLWGHFPSQEAQEGGKARAWRQFHLPRSSLP